jgi:L-fuconolactonase
MIDAHHHLWKYDPVEYSWISDSMSVLRRDFLPADLKERMDANGVAGAVSVQARQSLEETEWLTAFAEQHDFIRGVVGWVPLCSPDAMAYVERFAGRSKIKGFRHVVQDEPDDDFLLRDDFNAGIRALLPAGLVYDILIYERHLPQAIEFVDQHPNQIFVLDHIAKPRIRDRVFSPWRENLRELAKRENVYCKVSGVVTEDGWQRWTRQSIAPYMDCALEAFAARRLMFGSDWPVLELASDYGRWVSTVREWAGRLTADEQARVFSGTAIEAYRLY